MKKTLLVYLAFAMVLTFAFGASAWECIWDTTGPGFDGAPDGTITMNDDVMLCYYVYEDGQYAQYGSYFPRCDLDGNGTITLTEVYEVYYHMGQCPDQYRGFMPDSVCVEFYHYEGIDELVCSGPDYQRFASDLELIGATHPITNRVLSGEAESIYNPTLYVILCGATDDLPIDWFDELNAVYGAESRCLFQTDDMCGQLWPQFDQATNVWEALPVYLARAQAYDPEAFCDLNNYVGGGGQYMTSPGFHAGLNPVYGQYGVYDWTINILDDCDYYGCDCDMTITLSTYNNAIYFYDESGVCP